MRSVHAPGAAARRSFIQEARRDQIVSAAIETIAEVGYATASLARVAERAGVSVALVSYHFQGKEDLERAVIAHVTSSVDRLIGDRASGATSFRAALRAIVEGQVAWFAAHPDEAAALRAIVENARDADGRQRYASMDRERSIAELRAFLVDGQAASAFRDFDADVMAATLLAALEAVPDQLGAGGGHAQPATLATELAGIFERATGADP